jgi:GNAT superfamily N-acetyltransferase
MKGEIDPTRLKAYPATPSRWRDIEDLFGEHGACEGCWCMFLRLPRKQFDAGKGAANKRALQALVTSGRKPGVIAYAGKEPIGWCAVAPRQEYVALERSRILKAVDHQPVWSVSCLFVKRPYRRQGVSRYLISEAVKLAVSQGATVVESYPVEPTSDKTAAPSLWHGITTAFKAEGFREVARRADTRPIMRFFVAK